MTSDKKTITKSNSHFFLSPDFWCFFFITTFFGDKKSNLLANYKKIKKQIMMLKKCMLDMSRKKLPLFFITKKYEKKKHWTRKVCLEFQKHGRRESLMKS